MDTHIQTVTESTQKLIQITPVPQFLFTMTQIFAPLSPTQPFPQSAPVVLQSQDYLIQTYLHVQFSPAGLILDVWESKEI